MVCPPRTRRILLAATLCGLVAAAQARAGDVPAPEAVLATMRRVADWQLTAPLKRLITVDAWESGVFYTGVMALGDVAPDLAYHDAMLQLGTGREWKTKPGLYNPDNYVIGQTFLELYLRKHDSAMIAPLRAQFDEIMAHPADDNLDVRQAGGGKNNWSWCDTLYMGPGAWARMTAATGEAKYLDFACRNWWVTSDLLYDQEEHLFYRDSRFFDLRSKNDKKIFWARGNGWVIAGLVRVLQYLPEDHPDRLRFLRQYHEMAQKLVALQHTDGSWHPSLLDPGAPDEPEASGTGLFTYALAWGVNRGLLDRAEYEPVVTKAWATMGTFVQPDGRLAHVQPGGDRPTQFDANNNDSFGAGAFLLAGSEVYRLALLGDAPRVGLTVTSALAGWRGPETVEVDWKSLAQKVPGIRPEDVSVLPDLAAAVQVSQVIPDEGGQPKTLLFQSDFAPRQSRRFEVVAKAGLPKPQPPVPAYARFVPERLDDFAWENERTAHRMYGPALQKTGEVSSGVDLWVKHAHKALIDLWYKTGDYHQDHGDGGDFYKTGPTRGDGGLGIWDGGKLAVSKNYTAWKILANGPIRCVFRLEYAPWTYRKSIAVDETKTISLDLGSNLNRFQSDFKPTNAMLEAGYPVAVGITRRPGEEGFTDHLADGWMSYWSPADPGNGDVGCAVVFPPGRPAQAIQTPDNLLALVAAHPGTPLVYYAGGGWSKGDFPLRLVWEEYVRDFALRLRSPLVVSFPVTTAANP